MKRILSISILIICSLLMFSSCPQPEFRYLFKFEVVLTDSNNQPVSVDDSLLCVLYEKSTGKAVGVFTYDTDLNHYGYGFLIVSTPLDSDRYWELFIKPLFEKYSVQVVDVDGRYENVRVDDLTPWMPGKDDEYSMLFDPITISLTSVS